jgi:hypothetical protein
MRLQNARWNGEGVEAIRGTVMMAATTGFPKFWGRDLLGSRVEVLRITTQSGERFFIMDDDRQGTEKVLAGGGPWSGRGHRSVPVDDPETFVPYRDKPDPCPCKLCTRKRRLAARERLAKEIAGTLDWHSVRADIRDVDPAKLLNSLAKEVRDRIAANPKRPEGE